MAGDIFGYSRKSAKPTSVFDPTKSILMIQGKKLTGYLVQSWSINYTQQVNEIFELGSESVYWTKGRPSGDGQITRMVGEKSGAGLFPDEAYDVCDGGVALTFNASSGSCDGAKGFKAAKYKIQLDGCVVTKIGFSMQAPSGNGTQGMLNEDIGFRFSYLDVS